MSLNLCFILFIRHLFVNARSLFLLAATSVFIRILSNVNKYILRSFDFSFYTKKRAKDKLRTGSDKPRNRNL